MKLPATLSLIFVPAVVQAVLTTSFDPVYDNVNGSLATVACSNGANGLLTKGFTTFGSLPSFPFIGGAPAVTGFNSAGCGTCWKLAFTNSSNITTSINILAIDVATPNFNIALAAMNNLTNNQAEQLGRVPITATQVAASVCGLTMSIVFLHPPLIPNIAFTVTICVYGCRSDASNFKMSIT
ncbi:Allergen Asp f 15 homolg [Psilocybe cubensis]|uniref:Allergen Asp f 15 homolg n=2 Tax=Psilocybe cubensis TaxID=181762 RepID=A0ACB8H6X9_PSICU|nr:Allergen Asp f 15 homolg [Psilocybe cubensis]KAH9483666.1 Allergen Asp f 15 homolg [Psilocybe cubensis]